MNIMRCCGKIYFAAALFLIALERAGTVIQEENMTKENSSMEKNIEVKKGPVRQVIETILYFAVVFTVVLLVERFVMQPVQVEGSSMEPTLANENHLLLEKLTYLVADPERFDVVVFQPFEEEEELFYIKRIIGLPGERIYINNNIIYINGEPLLENYGKENVINDPGMASNEIVLGEGEYFVMGDNRNHSRDSRDASVGVVKRDSMIGRAWCRVWPLSKIGIIKHQ